MTLDPAQARRPCVLQRTHLAGDPPGPSDLVAELQRGAPLRPSGAPGRATQPGSGVTWNVGAHHPRRGAVAGFVRDSVHPKDVIHLGTSSSSTGNSLERMGYPPEKKSRCGCMRIRVIRRVPSDHAVPVLNPLGRGAATDHRGQKRASHRDPFSQPTAGSLALI